MANYFITSENIINPEKHTCFNTTISDTGDIVCSDADTDRIFHIQTDAGAWISFEWEEGAGGSVDEYKDSFGNLIKFHIVLNAANQFEFIPSTDCLTELRFIDGRIILFIRGGLYKYNYGIEFDRDYNMPRLYENVPSSWLDDKCGFKN